MPGPFIVIEVCYSDSQLGSNFPPRAYGHNWAWREQSKQTRTSKRKPYIFCDANLCFNSLV